MRDNEDVERLLDRGHSKNLLIKDVINPLLVTLDYSGLEKEASRWWPLGKDMPIVVDPARSFGEPIIAGSRVPTRVLYAAHRAGESESAVADWYGVSVAEVIAAIRFENTHGLVRAVS